VGSGLDSKENRLDRRKVMTNAMMLFALPILILASPMGCSSQTGHPGESGVPQSSGGASATGGVGTGGASDTAGTGGKGSGLGGASATGGVGAGGASGTAGTGGKGSGLGGASATGGSLGADQCRLNSDCPGGEACIPPGGTWSFCGICSYPFDDPRRDGALAR